VAEQRTNGNESDAQLEFDRAARGAELLPALPTPAPDAPDLDRVLAEIPAKYGITAPSPIFQALANWPGFLVSAWTAWEPLIDTPAYRAALATVVAPAVPVGERVASSDPALAEYLALQRSMLPELLLLASAWYDSARGVGTGSVGRESTAARAVRASALKPAAAEPRIDEALDSIRVAHGHPRILSVYRVIASDRDFLLDATPSLLAAIASPEYAAARQALLDAAAAAPRTLDMPAVPSSDEGPLEILALFRNRLIPSLVLDTALFTAMLAPQENP
jgi:hypothetical protein